MVARGHAPPLREYKSLTGGGKGGKGKGEGLLKGKHGMS